MLCVVDVVGVFVVVLVDGFWFCEWCVGCDVFDEIWICDICVGKCDEIGVVCVD